MQVGIDEREDVIPFEYELSDAPSDFSLFRVRSGQYISISLGNCCKTHPTRSYGLLARTSVKVDTDSDNVTVSSTATCARRFGEASEL